MESVDLNSISLQNRSRNNFPFVEEKVMRTEEPSLPVNKENSEQGQLYTTEGDLFAGNGFQQAGANYSNTYCFGEFLSLIRQQMVGLFLISFSS